MDINVTSKLSDNGIQLVEVQGEIDVYTSPCVKEKIGELIGQDYNFLIVNLENVRYIDSTGLGVLIGALKKVREKEGWIRLVCSNPQIIKIFEITGLKKIFDIFPTNEDASVVEK